MNAEPESELEIAHVLFADIVGYSKLLTNEQRTLVEQLNQIVRHTEQFRAAEAAGKLIRLATGDGMALAFFTSPEAPVRCAIEMARALQKNQQLQLRMGIDSGPVDQMSDLNDRSNVAGAGINMAQRVMDCGDAGHILLSKRVAGDLGQFSRWQAQLHDLGEVEVKHGVKIGVVNFVDGGIGNPELPEKVRRLRHLQSVTVRRRTVIWSLGIVTVLALLGVAFWFQSRRHAPSAATNAVDKSIAVLPFENLSDDKQNTYFADGVQDEILTYLAKIADLKVISRTSVMQYKSGAPRNLREIAQQLGVACVLEGSVQRAGGKVRVNAQLIEARTDKHLWAKTYDREVADVFAIETELAQSIANELQAKLSADEKVSLGEQPTNDLVAHDFYVRATSLVDAGFISNSEKDLYQAVDLLNQAVARDPAFLPAYCELARAHDALYLTGIDHTPGRLTVADSAIKVAFRLRPDAGEAHLALAYHRYWGYFDFEGARAEIALAARTLPNNPRVFELSGFVDRRQGRWADAVRNMERVCELDPQSVRSVINLAVTYWLLRDYERQRGAIDRLLAINPHNLVGRVERPYIEIHRRADIQPLHAALEKILADDPAAAEDQDVKSTRFWLALYGRDFTAAERALADLPQKNPFGDEDQLSRAFFAGLVERTKGDAETAQAAFSRARLDQEEAIRAQPDDAATLAGLGAIDAGLGRKEEALREGRKAIEVLSGPKSDPAERPNVQLHFAQICAWTGERDLALEQLETLAKMPGGPSYGDLRLSPMWDSLRDDPRFEKIVADLAPKN